jgi:hypothetical protein
MSTTSLLRARRAHTQPEVLSRTNTESLERRRSPLPSGVVPVGACRSCIGVGQLGLPWRRPEEEMVR